VNTTTVESVQALASLRVNPLFQQLAEEELERILALAEVVEAEAGTAFIREGDTDKALYLIEQGQVDIVKENAETGERYKLVTLGAGNCIGETSVLEGDTRRTATVVTVTRATLIRIDFDRIAADPAYDAIRLKLISHVAKSLSGKLSSTNDITAAAIKRELEISKARIAMGLFTVNLLFMLGIYTLALQSLNSLVVNFGSNLISIAILALMATVMFVMIRRSGYPLRTFGLTLKNGMKVTRQAVLLTIPLLAGIALLKGVVLYLHPEIDDRVFGILSLFEGGRLDLTFVLYGVAYALFCPVQEFISRSGIQSALQNFLPESRSRVWIAIILSNLMFSTAHSHVNLTFAMLTFFPGLFWGWMYARQHSLLGASVSHMLVGVWIFFIVGIDKIWVALF